VVLLDTHVLVWLVEGSDRLGKKSRELLDRSLQVAELFVSTISFWEVAMLVAKGRLNMAQDVSQWRQDLLGSGLKEMAAGGEVAVNSATLQQFHGDAADRIIVATAMQMNSSLCTADRRILEWHHDLERIDARR